MATDEPPTKKLRSCEPDLKIILKYETNDGRQEQKEYEMYGAVLGKMSGFVDAALSSGMKEQASREIVFDGITPEVFELALRFGDDILAAHAMTAKDAHKVVSFYHQYDFARGLQLCDYVFKEYLSMHPCDDYQTPPQDLDLLVNVIAEAERLDLTESKPLGIDYVRSRFDKSKFASSTLTATMFTVEHLRSLQNLLKTLDVHGDTLTKEELDSPLFPRYIFERLRRDALHIDFANKLTRGGSDEFTLIRSERAADGSLRIHAFLTNDEGNWRYAEMDF